MKSETYDADISWTDNRIEIRLKAIDWEFLTLQLDEIEI